MHKAGTGCGKTKMMKGTGFSPYINLSRMNGASAPEGKYSSSFAHCSLFFATSEARNQAPGSAFAEIGSAGLSFRWPRSPARLRFSYGHNSMDHRPIEFAEN